MLQGYPHKYGPRLHFEGRTIIRNIALHAEVKLSGIKLRRLSRKCRLDGEQQALSRERCIQTIFGCAVFEYGRERESNQLGLGAEVEFVKHEESIHILSI